MKPCKSRLILSLKQHKLIKLIFEMSCSWMWTSCIVIIELIFIITCCTFTMSTENLSRENTAIVICRLLIFLTQVTNVIFTYSPMIILILGIWTINFRTSYLGYSKTRWFKDNSQKIYKSSYIKSITAGGSKQTMTHWRIKVPSNYNFTPMEPTRDTQ